MPLLDESPGEPGGTTQPALPRARRPVGGIIAIVLLSVALAASGAALAYHLVKLDDANTRILEQERELEEQQQLIDRKETFGAAMHELMVSAVGFEGVLMASMVPFDRYQTVASRAWTHRWNPSALERDIAEIVAATKELDTLRSAASTQASTNSTGTVYETIIDQLGGGFVASVLDDADALCDSDVLACVSSDDPYTVHFDVADSSLPYMTDWLQTGLAYHEFAHVLQMTNPAPTETARAYFGGDDETMADCFALTYLDGWTLDHRVWSTKREYWDVSIGYGHVCDDTQRQAVRDWYGQLGVQVRPISQLA